MACYELKYPLNSTLINKLITMASLILSFFLLLSITPLPLFVHSSGGFTVSLTHRDSIHSPYRNPFLSNSNRFRAAARRSIARAEHLGRSRIVSPATAPAPASGPSAIPIDSEVIPDGFEYLMEINIGSPPFKVLAIADTGSDLIWTQCRPCTECYNQTAPIFNPNTSSTYATVSCDASVCAALDGVCPVVGTSTCEYSYSYGDGSNTDGDLSTETFTFDSESEGTVSIPKIFFGCSHRSTGTFKATDGGLVGLGGGPLSLVSQLGPMINNKFSYCLIPYYDMSHSRSHLNFGDNAEIVDPNAVTTPMVVADPKTFYYLSLEDITVGGEKVTAGADTQQVIIDSGTTLTFLNSKTVDALVDKLSQLVKYPRVNDSDFNFCVDVSGASEIDLPEMTFGFSGAPVTVPARNVFVMVEEGLVCLAVVGSDYGIQIFGNVAQQDLHVGYDLGARTVTFAPADCTKM